MILAPTERESKSAGVVQQQIREKSVEVESTAKENDLVSDGEVWCFSMTRGRDPYLPTPTIKTVHPYRVQKCRVCVNLLPRYTATHPATLPPTPLQGRRAIGEY